MWEIAWAGERPRFVCTRCCAEANTKAARRSHICEAK